MTIRDWQFCLHFLVVCKVIENVFVSQYLIISNYRVTNSRYFWVDVLHISQKRGYFALGKVIIVER